MQDGWYHTGDIGDIDADGFLRITDRKKELFKTSGGKFVAPSRVEAAIKRSVYVNQVMLVGDGRPHPAALVSPNWDLVRTELGIAPDVPAADLLAPRRRRRLSDARSARATPRIWRNSNRFAKSSCCRAISPWKTANSRRRSKSNGGSSRRNTRPRSSASTPNAHAADSFHRLRTHDPHAPRRRGSARADQKQDGLSGAHPASGQEQPRPRLRPDAAHRRDLRRADRREHEQDLSAAAAFGRARIS